MSKEIRVGIMGCGKIADVCHVPGYLGVKGVRIISLLDSRPDVMDQLRKQHRLDAQCFTDMEAFLKSGVEAVSICTPNNLHVPQTIAALEAGVHVLCEKPMAATPDEATKVIKVAHTTGMILQINQTMRYMASFQKVASLVASGVIGEVIHLRCFRAHAATPDKAWSPGAFWFVSKASQGGLVLDIAVHMADFLQWLGGEITEVAAITGTRTPGIDVVDNATALMRFENGATGTLTLSWTIPCGMNVTEVYGTKGTIRIGAVGEEDIELIAPGPEGKAPRITRPKPAKKVKDSHQCFIDAIRGKAPSPTPGELGRGAVALCDAIMRAGETGKYVKVKRY